MERSWEQKLVDPCTFDVGEHRAFSQTFFVKRLTFFYYLTGKCWRPCRSSAFVYASIDNGKLLSTCEMHQALKVILIWPVLNTSLSIPSIVNWLLNERCFTQLGKQSKNKDIGKGDLEHPESENSTEDVVSTRWVTLFPPSHSLQFSASASAIHCI